MRLKNILFSAALIVCSCSAPSTQSDAELFMSRTEICFVVGHKDMLDFTTNGIQTSFNASKNIFRAGIPSYVEDMTTGNLVETVDKYFILALNSSIPASGTVNGKIYLKTDQISTGFRTYDSELEVKKTQGELVWLWDDSKKIGIVIRNK